MIRKPSKKNWRRGVAAVEMALSMPVFLILISGMYEVSRLAEIQQILCDAAREGGRQASTGLVDNTAVKAVVQNYLETALNDGDSTGNLGIKRAKNAVITVADLDFPGTDAMKATQLDTFKVTVTVPYADVLGIALPTTVASPTTAMTGQATWYSMKDKQYPSTISPPAGY